MGKGRVGEHLGYCVLSSKAHDEVEVPRLSCQLQALESVTPDCVPLVAFI